jgi:hypothetical protein
MSLLRPDNEADMICSAIGSFVKKVKPPPLPSGLDWPRLERIGGRNSVMPILLSILDNSQVPKDMVRRWRQLSVGAELFYQRAKKAAIKVCRIFEEEGIPAVVLRGMALTQSVYADPALRPMVDVDILVPESVRQVLPQIMKKQGFVAKLTLRSQFVYRIDGVVFEIHWSLLTPKRYRNIVDSATWLESRRLIRTDDGALYCLSPENELLELVCHSFIHHEVNNLLQLLDIALVSNLNALDWDYLVSWCRDASVTRLFFFTVGLADQLFKLGLRERLDEVGVAMPSLCKDMLDAYRASLFGADTRWQFMRRKANLLRVAESPMVKLRQAVRFFSVEELCRFVRCKA